MHRISLIAAASMIAFSSAHAAEQEISTQQDDRQPTATPQARDASSSHATKNVLTSGQASPGAANAIVLSQSSMRAPALVPMTPFVSFAMSGHAANDQELQALIQEVQERERAMLQNAEYRDLLRARQRVSLGYSHPDLPAMLQISKEQARQLLDLLADQQVRAQAATDPLGPGPADPAAVQEFMENTQERQRANDAEIAALLGDGKFQEWKEYEQSGMARFHVQRLQQVLPPEARLRSDQLRPLVTAIAREQRQMFDETALTIPQNEVPDDAWQSRMRESHMQRMSATHQRILDASASILSSQQLESFRSLLQQDLEGNSQGQFFFGRMAPVPPPARR